MEKSLLVDLVLAIMVDQDNNQGIEEDIQDKPGASAIETESCSLRSTVILQDCETW